MAGDSLLGEQIINGRRSNGPVIARDVLTGVETTYECAAAAESGCVALRALSISSKLLQQTYIDKKRQLGGFSWRSAEFRPTSHWIPPSGFVFDPTQRNTGVLGYVAASLSEPRTVRIVYDSTQLAARANQQDERRLNGYVRAGLTHNGIAWSKLDHADAGRWSDEPQLPQELDGTYVTPETVAAPSTRIVASGANARSYGRVIARNLLTGEDVFFKNAEKVSDRFRVSAHAIRETFIDKPRQMFGHHLRSFESGRVWRPPARLVYDPDSCEKSKHGYIVCTTHDGSIVTMYESIKAAGDANGGRTAMQNISYRLDSGKVCSKGFLWRRAKPEEFETFEDVARGTGSTTTSSDDGGDAEAFEDKDVVDKAEVAAA